MPESIQFKAHEASDIPTDHAVSLALLVIKNQKILSDLVLKVLWDDLHGTGANTGMWWHGSFDEAFEDSKVIPDTCKKLVHHLKFSSVVIHNTSDIDAEPVLAELAFYAEFEEEHGVGFLTDGKSILGIGYMYTTDKNLKNIIGSGD